MTEKIEGSTPTKGVFWLAPVDGAIVSGNVLETTCEQAGRLSSRRFALESGLSLHVNPENVNGIRFVVTPTEPIIRRGS